jgi:acetyltransferase-like isoleucine patch superfamily enzyme
MEGKKGPDKSRYAHIVSATRPIGALRSGRKRKTDRGSSSSIRRVMLRTTSDRAVRLLRDLGGQITKAPGARFRRDVRLGHVQIGVGSYGSPEIIDFSGRYRPAVTIGNYCSIAGEVAILIDPQHHVEWVTTFPIQAKLLEDRSWSDGSPRASGPVTIGHDVWIGFRVTILGGCTIGDGSVIAAGSVVKDDVEPFMIVGGVPAKPIRRRFDERVCDELSRLRWWDLNPSEVCELRRLLSSEPDIEALQKALGRRGDL